MRFAELLTILVFASALAGCANSRDPAKGFRLAANGDPVRGKTAFVEFGCHQCHQVEGGSNLPAPSIQRIALGGSVMHQPSDGYLVAAIINPTYHRSAYPSKDVSAVHAGMPEFASRMTVQQLTDIVVYLKTRYSIMVSVPREFP